MKLKQVTWYEHKYGSGFTGYVGKARVCEIDYKDGRYVITVHGPNITKTSWTDDRKKAKELAPAFIEKVLTELLFDL